MIACDLPFARDICADAASYFNPSEPTCAAKQIVELILNPALAEAKISQGITRLGVFPNYETKNERLVNLINSLTHHAGH